ncbi:MAG: M14 family zinc carboxypeptidase [candidate division KSB1 bacterium]|nr:M14 family zinc carboxypeptidase [candidate division KSB1 bacterium]MDZ7304279.1 M14 family zinc carboxypeptidase [candidate division KSB1 bacterium]MDZ7312922.1 M14 family zinc carboxypeptidase [candidate division KSB1 bacterium]
MRRYVPAVILVCILSFIPASPDLAQAPREIPAFQIAVDRDDPCGFDPILAKAQLAALGPGWGYNYDSLLTDLKAWRQSPYLAIDSVGASVQNRALWRLTIASPITPVEPRLRIWVHARTHPNEVQGWWVTDEMIKLLLGETPLARLLRERCIFNIMPMYNPDGVELGLPRQNAHGVDLESNWDKTPNEPEVIVLRSQFQQFMASPSPIRIALNMHSSTSCKRYFVYHDATGTSPAYAADEQNFITRIRQHFPTGIENWNYFVSWVGSTATQYPESWFWFNHREAVMALTYEDMNCPSAGQYDKTAFALLQGIVDYLKLVPASVTAAEELPGGFALAPNYPNPLHGGIATIIRFRVGYITPVRLLLHDALGREVMVLHEGLTAPGTYQVEINSGGLASGVYFYRLQTGAGTLIRRLLITK